MTNEVRNTARLRRHHAVEALLRGASTTEAAAAAGVNSRTLRRWRLEPDFRALIQHGQEEIISAAAHRSFDLGRVALDTLAGIAQDSKAPEHARVAACRALLDTMTKMHDILAVNDRLDTLEAQLKELAPCATPHD